MGMSKERLERIKKWAAGGRFRAGGQVPGILDWPDAVNELITEVERLQALEARILKSTSVSKTRRDRTKHMRPGG